MQRKKNISLIYAQKERKSISLMYAQNATERKRKTFH